MNKLPVEINSEMKIFGFSLTVILYAAVGMFFGSQTKEWIYAPLQKPWIIFNIIIWLFLGLPSPINKGKRVFSSLIIYLTRDDKTYESIPNPRSIDEREQLKPENDSYMTHSK